MMLVHGFCIFRQGELRAFDAASNAFANMEHGQVVGMAAKIVQDLEANSYPEHKKDAHDARQVVPAELVVGSGDNVPCDHEHQVFYVGESVEKDAAQSGMTLDQVEEAEDVDEGSQETEAEFEPTRVMPPTRGRLQHAVPGFLLDHPYHHDHPVDGHHHKDIVVEVGCKEGQSQHPRGDGADAPKELQDHAPEGQLGLLRQGQTEGLLEADQNGG